jgi:hypothetical protein
MKNTTQNNQDSKKPDVVLSQGSQVSQGFLTSFLHWVSDMRSKYGNHENGENRETGRRSCLCGLLEGEGFKVELDASVYAVLGAV